jgi:hypothetical protein
VKADRGWNRPFDYPIPLPKGRRLVTLKDAATYIIKLPKSEHTAPEWQAAMEALILVATLGGPTMFERVGMLRALNHGKPNPSTARGKVFCVIWATLVWFLSLALKLPELQLYLRSSTRRRRYSPQTSAPSR